MATLLHIEVQDPQNVIDTYGVEAVYRIERGTSAAMTDASEITSLNVAATQTEYEFVDTTGIAGTHWYRVRYAKDAASVPEDYSGYGPVFQGSPGGEIITLETVKTWQDIPDTLDDAWLPIGIGSCNRRALNLIGVDIGPSPDTVRTYDGSRAMQDGRRLYIPGGIRSFTAVEVSTDAGLSWTAVTSDVRIGPASHSRPYGQPGSYIEFVALPAGSYQWFPAGTDNVRITAVAFMGFGWDAYPSDLVHRVSQAAQRMYADRMSEQGYPNEAAASRYIPDDDPTCAYYHDLYFSRLG